MVLADRWNGRWFWLKAGAHALALWPLAAIVADVRADALGADPVAVLTERTGEWALWLLLGTLGLTPLRRLLGRPWPIRFRRLVGLYAFFYACLHLAVFVVLDLGAYWAQLLEDIVARPYITAGFAAWCLLAVLAATSPRAVMRRLGRRWGPLHRTIYLAAALAVLHVLWLVKSVWGLPLAYAGALAVLLGLRAWWRWGLAQPVARGA